MEKMLKQRGVTEKRSSYLLLLNGQKHCQCRGDEVNRQNVNVQFLFSHFLFVVLLRGEEKKSFNLFVWFWLILYSYFSTREMKHGGDGGRSKRMEFMCIY